MVVEGVNETSRQHGRHFGRAARRGTQGNGRWRSGGAGAGVGNWRCQQL